MLSPPIDFEWLKDLHRAKRMQLSFSVGMSGLVHLNDDPQALVSELLRLAEIGQKLEIQTAGRLAGEDVLQ